MFGGGDSAPAPWRGRLSGLVRLLKDWGAGTPYEVAWWRAGEERRATIAVELGPPAFDSAPRRFDEKAGLEVRDLTYEVRHVLRMDPAAPGVVVGRVEPGSAAAQARIAANELILEMDGRPVADAAAFAKGLEAARGEARKQVRLVVRRLGRTRIVDLHLSAPPAPPAEEGPAPSVPEDGGGEDGAGRGDAPPPGDDPGEDAEPGSGGGA
jgi:membrane-associated protease RseP (regulator of RpoE activity)